MVSADELAERSRAMDVEAKAGERERVAREAAEGTVAAVLGDDEELAEHIRSAFSNPAADANTGAYFSASDDLRFQTMDGCFDLIVVARLLREPLRAEMLKWLHRKPEAPTKA